MSISGVVFPSTTKENEYINRVSEILRDGGIEVYSVGVGGFLRSLKSDKRFFLISWIENQTRQRGVLGLFLIVGFVLFVRLFGFKVLWVRHNFISHDLITSYQRRLNLVAIKFMEYCSNEIFCHSCEVSKKLGYTYLPHPVYKVKIDKRYPSSKYLIFGRINAYKRIEKVLSDLPEIDLDIVGKIDKSYEITFNEAIDKSKAKVFLNNTFVSSGLLDSMIRDSKAVIVTNDGESSIVSGVVFHALSLGTNVVCNSKKLYDQIGELSGFHYIEKFEFLEDLNFLPEDVVRADILKKNNDEVFLKIVKSGVL